jgi:hypothetical protein
MLTYKMEVDMRTRLTLIAVSLFFILVGSVQGADRRLYGSWKTSTYTLQGVDIPMDGLMIFTPSYFSANTIWSGKNSVVDANANSGPYFAENGKIIFSQWMQLHVRHGDQKESFLRTGIDEPSTYRFETNDRLIIQFPTGNYYLLDRLIDSPAMAGLEGLWSYETLKGSGRDPVGLTGLMVFHQGLFLQQAIHHGDPADQQMGQAHSGTYTSIGSKLHLKASVGLITSPPSIPPLTTRTNSSHELDIKRDDDSLVLQFRTGTIQTFTRVPLEGKVSIFKLDRGSLALLDDRFILVAEKGNRSATGSGYFRRKGDHLHLRAQRWCAANGDEVEYLFNQEVLARFDGTTLVLPGDLVLRVLD